MASGSIYGLAPATCTQRIYVVAFELGVDLKLVPVDLSKGEHKQLPHLARQPFGQIPAYESADGKTKLFESRAITRYIDAKSGGKLGHRDTLENAALVETWLSVEQANFDKHASPIVVEEVFKKLYGQETNQELVKKHMEGIAPILDVYEKELTNRSYLAGNSLSLADLHHLPYGSIFTSHLTCINVSSLIEKDHLFRTHPELLASRPHLKKWWESLAALPSWKKTLDLHKP